MLFSTPDNLLDEVLRRLRRSTVDPAHPFHWPVFGTVDAAGHPKLRTVVLRAI